MPFLRQPRGRSSFSTSGVQPLANNLLRPQDLAKPEPKFPLRLAVCQSCWLLQIIDLVPPVELFSEYLYFSSFSDLMLRHAREAAERYIREFGLDAAEPGDRNRQQRRLSSAEFPGGRRALPGDRAGAEHRQSGSGERDRDAGGVFRARPSRRNCLRRDRQADLILGNNVFAHAPNTNDFVAGLRTAAQARGRDHPGVSLRGRFHREDRVRHDLSRARVLLQPDGAGAVVRAARAEHFPRRTAPIHGGSLRLFAGLAGAHTRQDSVAALLAEEERKGHGHAGLLRRLRRAGAGVEAAR